MVPLVATGAAFGARAGGALAAVPWGAGVAAAAGLALAATASAWRALRSSATVDPILLFTQESSSEPALPPQALTAACLSRALLASQRVFASPDSFTLQSRTRRDAAGALALQVASSASFFP